MRRSQFTPLSDAEAKVAAQEYQTGQSIEMVARRFGHSRRQVREGIEGLGVPIRASYEVRSPNNPAVEAWEVCHYADGSSTVVSHGESAESARAMMAAMMRGREPLPGYPRTEAA